MTSAPAWLSERPFAHRGLHGAGLPENSLAAVDAAIAAGYGIEIDVLGSADGEVLVFHDDDLERMTARPGRLDGLPSAALAELRLADSDEAIPSLAQVLERVADRVPLLIEIKARDTGASRGAGRLEAAAWQVLRDYRGRFAVQSFNPLSLYRFRRLAPAVPRGQISGDFRHTKLPGGWPAKVLARRFAFNWLSRPHFIVDDVGRQPCAAAQRLRHRLPLLLYTVRSAAQQETAGHFADNIIFEEVRPQLRLPGAALELVSMTE
ncbi:MAG TPA: glycerophosphodiester phosphodiesterase family protein [Alphaproteobacteria bacterium]|jgi:glycerophosphoryl diester phosphodiesterase|nr:glycerophosphodiester phosphodiesterase family protein [Alphaproteobacteria bacterium]MDP6271872.1 glycerophosphodiester phosphodiesterase family protein [Alphaproteobacteria bacterium]MDP7426953.1 glycerophosphodiester phosphodiesterase family protein [Alphaproteobacteria bacterium]HJM48247.1 glycerophosphodiester phosphodiesterase family protein [Alphaproteobacteria bacterium]|tara:strand:- start:323 stop:1114 length:792 start_codon:yes stop_codon:yes gene_type:complete